MNSEKERPGSGRQILRLSLEERGSAGKFLPAIVHPDPLFGMLPDPFFREGRHAPRHLGNFFGGGQRRSEGEIEKRSEPDPVAPAGKTARKRRKNRKILPQRNPGRPGVGSGRPAEKGNRDPLRGAGTLVHGQNDNFISGEGPQNGPDPSLLRGDRQGLPITQAPLPDECVDLGVPNLACDDMTGNVEIQSQAFADQLPVPEVGDDGQDSPTLSETVPDEGEIVDQDMVAHPSVIENGKAEKLGAQAAEVAKDIGFGPPESRRPAKIGIGLLEVGANPPGLRGQKNPEQIPDLRAQCQGNAMSCRLEEKAYPAKKAQGNPGLSGNRTSHGPHLSQKRIKPKATARGAARGAEGFRGTRTKNQEKIFFPVNLAFANSTPNASDGVKGKADALPGWMPPKGMSFYMSPLMVCA